MIIKQELLLSVEATAPLYQIWHHAKNRQELEFSLQQRNDEISTTGTRSFETTCI